MNEEKKFTEVKEMIEQFIVSRNWDHFHTPKSLSMSISIEAAEIMELFQWCGNKESEKIAQDSEKKAELADEIADTAIYLYCLARKTGIDILDSMKEKMRRNENRFPYKISE